MSTGYEVATVDDLRVSKAAVIARSGFTEQEIRDQAAAHDFPNLHAKLAWWVISALDELEPV